MLALQIHVNEISDDQFSLLVVAAYVSVTTAQTGIFSETTARKVNSLGTNVPIGALIGTEYF